MTVPNAGPLQSEPTDPGMPDNRRGNPAHGTSDDPVRGMAAASTRATAVSHRFGGVRHALTRSDRFPAPEPHPDEGGDPDASH